MAIETLYKVEPPLQEVDDGFGYWGGLTYDTDTDKVQCHICGKWRKGLYGPHLKAHNLTAREYKLRFGLSVLTPLCSRGTSYKHSVNAIRLKSLTLSILKKGMRAARRFKYQSRTQKYAKNNAAYRNKRGTCTEQLKRRYEVICEQIGKETATREDMRSLDPVAFEAIKQRFGGLTAFRTKFKYPLIPQDQRWTEVKLIAEIQRMATLKKRLPNTKDFRGQIKGAPSWGTIHKHFGSLNRALTVSLGLDERKVS